MSRELSTATEVGAKKPTVGYIGLGDMGGPIAESIARAGFPLLLWARQPETLNRIQTRTFTAVESSELLASRSDIIGLCVFDEDDVRELLGRMLPSMRRGAVVLVNTTTSPSAAREFALLGEESGIDVLDAPVSGGRTRAQVGALTVMVGGDSDAYDRSLGVLRAFGSLVRRLGPAGSGQQVKNLNNALLAVNMGTALTALDAVRAFGLDEDATKEVLLASSGGSPAMQGIFTTWASSLARAAHGSRMMAKEIASFRQMCDDSGIVDVALAEQAEAVLTRLLQLTAADGMTWNATYKQDPTD